MYEMYCYMDIKHRLWERDIGKGYRFLKYGWKRINIIKWIDTVNNEKFLIKVKENRKISNTFGKMKENWI